MNKKLLLYLITILIIFTYKGVFAKVINDVSEIELGKSYYFYDGDKAFTLYDSDGRNEGWLQYESNSNNNRQKFSIENSGEKFLLRNEGTGYYIKEGKGLNGKLYVVSDKTGAVKLAMSIEKNQNAFLLKATIDGSDYYVRRGEDRAYATFTQNVNDACKFIIEEAPGYAYPEGSQTLWKNPDGTNFYRIPAIAVTNSGRVIAACDYRYHYGTDLGNHKIDLYVKYSDDNGKTWSSSQNITSFNDRDDFGYGDPAIVADRDSGEVAIFCAYGTQGYWHGNPAYVSKRDNPIRVARFISNDNGNTFSAPEEITSSIYGLDDRFERLFIAAGRIVQSRFVKIGKYYRLYTAILEGRTGGNWVLYSDDFGKTWNRLGDSVSPVNGGDEAKIEELPNGNVLISSRKNKGRYINIFNFYKNDTSFKTGSWQSRGEVAYGNGSATNGEVYYVYVKDNMTGNYTYLAMQTLPTLRNARYGVGVYYKDLGTNTATVEDYTLGWSESKFMMIQPETSAYSTIALLNDGNIAFLYEDRATGYGYDIQFYKTSIETITKGRYSLAFSGIGTKDNPYLLDSEEKIAARNSVYKGEKVYFKEKEINLSPTLSPEPSTSPDNTPVESQTLTETMGPNETPKPTQVTNQKFTIKFDLNGGKINGSTEGIIIKAKANDIITIPKSIPQKVGYKFEYWKGSKYMPGDKYTVTQDHTFIAVYKNIAANKITPKTGDNTNIYLAFISTILSLSLVILFAKKKNNI